MQAVILAAGVGSRLRPLTDEVPKCLVKVLGKPILEYQIDSYLQAEVEDIIVVSGYLGDKIEAFINERYSQCDKIRIIENKEYAQTNNMYSLYLAQKLIRDEFLLSNADVVFPIDMITYIVDKGYKNCIAVDKGNYNDESMKITVEDYSVQAISKKISEEQSYGTSIDVYKFGTDANEVIFDIINRIIEKEKNLNSWTEVALDQTFKKVEFKPLTIEGRYWYEIDNHDDLRAAEEKIKETDDGRDI